MSSELLLDGNTQANKKTAELKAINDRYNEAIAAFGAYVAQQEQLQNNTAAGSAVVSSSTPADQEAVHQPQQTEKLQRSHISVATLKSMKEAVEKVITKLETDEYYSKHPEKSTNVKQIMTRALTATQNYATNPNEQNTKEFLSSRREVGRLGTIADGAFATMTSIAIITFFVGVVLTASGVGGLAGLWLMMTGMSILSLGNVLTIGSLGLFKGKEDEDRGPVKDIMVEVEGERKLSSCERF